MNPHDPDAPGGERPPSAEPRPNAEAAPSGDRAPNSAAPSSAPADAGGDVRAPNVFPATASLEDSLLPAELTAEEPTAEQAADPVLPVALPGDSEHTVPSWPAGADDGGADISHSALEPAPIPEAPLASALRAAARFGTTTSMRAADPNASAARRAADPNASAARGAVDGRGLDLRVEGMVVTRDRPVLRGVDLDLARGQRLGLMGANGAGKSTLLAVLAGVLRPTAGEALFGGRPARDPEVRRSVGWVPEHGALPQRATVGELLRLGATFAGLEAKRAAHAVERLVDEAALGGLLDRTTPTLSVGERQRAAVALALIGRPRWLLLDEPFAGLDSAGRRAMMALLLKQSDVGWILASHHAAELAATCSFLAHLEDGVLSAPEPVGAALAAMNATIGVGIAATGGSGPQGVLVRRIPAGERGASVRGADERLLWLDPDGDPS